MAKKKEKIKVTCPTCGKSVKARKEAGTIINHNRPFNPGEEPERCSGSGFHIQSKEVTA